MEVGAHLAWGPGPRQGCAGNPRREGVEVHHFWGSVSPYRDLIAGREPRQELQKIA